MSWRPEHKDSSKHLSKDASKDRSNPGSKHPAQTPCDEFFSDVSSQFPPQFISRKAEDLNIYGTDWTRVFTPDPSAVVFPRSTQDVCKFLTLCTHHQVSVVPSGGRTGLAGGAVAPNREVVISMEKMNTLGAVDDLANTVIVQAGAVTEAVHQHCLKQGLTWPVDFASKGSAQVGGNIATNAGGVKVIHYGPTRNWVLGLEMVKMDGTVLSFNGALEKNNTGLDLRHLVIGSEGILGIVTAATLKLCRPAPKLDVFFFALKDIEAVLSLFRTVRKTSFKVNAFEFLTLNCLQSVHDIIGLPLPFKSSPDHQAFVLLELEQPEAQDGRERLDTWLSSLFESGLVLDGTLAQSPNEGRQLWQLRENITESLSQKGMIYKNDIALPISGLKDFIQEFEAMPRAFETFVFGHIGDGNLHINVLKPETMSKDEFLAQCLKSNLQLYALIKKHHGSISAEHGIGLLKKSALHFTRSEQEIELMKSVKRAFDPLNLLNPGKIFNL